MKFCAVTALILGVSVVSATATIRNPAVNSNKLSLLSDEDERNNIVNHANMLLDQNYQVPEVNAYIDRLVDFYQSQHAYEEQTGTGRAANKNNNQDTIHHVHEQDVQLSSAAPVNSKSVGASSATTAMAKETGSAHSSSSMSKTKSGQATMTDVMHEPKKTSSKSTVSSSTNSTSSSVSASKTKSAVSTGDNFSDKSSDGIRALAMSHSVAIICLFGYLCL